MKKQTQAIHVPYKRRDAYDALSMPVYNAVAYELDNAQTMSDAFCNRIDAPDYSRCENPTVSNLRSVSRPSPVQRMSLHSTAVWLPSAIR